VTAVNFVSGNINVLKLLVEFEEPSSLPGM